jgi:hypothetical protein
MSYSQSSLQPDKMILKDLFYLTPCHLLARNLDAISCARGDVDHFLKLRMFEGSHGLSMDG